MYPAPGIYVNIKYANEYSTINMPMFRQNSTNVMGLASKLTVHPDNC